MIDPNASLSPRVLALAAIAFFAPIVASFFIARGAWWVPIPGILFHLCLFLLVPKLAAPDWAKAAGYGWLVLDVMTGVMTLNNVPHSTYDYVRLGGHIFGGMWTVVVSLPGSLGVRISGIIFGGSIFLYSFVSPFVPPTVLSPVAILTLVWLGFIAWQNGVKSAPKSFSGLTASA